MTSPGRPGRHGRNILWLAGSNAAGFAVSVFYFRFLSENISVEENNWYATFFSFAPVLMVLNGLGFSDVITRERAREPGRARSLIPTALVLEVGLFVVLLPAVAGLTLALGYEPPLRLAVLLAASWPAGQVARPDARLLLAGPCDHTPEARELSEELEARFSEAGLGDTVRFAGLVSDPERYVRAADILAFPSRKEGLPNALIEAQASGLPAVASRLPGCTTDVVEDGETGLLVEPGEAQKLAAAARGRALERFNLDAVADAYRGLYGEWPSRRGDAS